MKPDFFITIAGEAYAGINHPQSSIDALFPAEGRGSMKTIIENLGDDLDVVMQSASYFRVAVGRDGYSAIETAGDHRPLVLSPSGEIVEAKDGERFFLSSSDDDVLFATCFGWKPNDEAVRCFGARIPD